VRPLSAIAGGTHCKTDASDIVIGA
jgi:hypothetical protein